MTNETKSHLMTFGEAIELAKVGVPIASVNMRGEQFICLTEGKIAITDELWNVHNRMAAHNNGGELWVQPYFLLTDTFSTVPYAFSNIDIFAGWMKASVKSLAIGMKIVDDFDLEITGRASPNPERGYTIKFDYVDTDTQNLTDLPLGILFDSAKWIRAPKVVITKTQGSLLGNIIVDVNEGYHARCGEMTTGRKLSKLSNSVNEIIITDEMSLKEATDLINEASKSHYDTICFIIDADAFGDTGSVSDYLTNTIHTMDDRKDVVFNISLKEHIGL